MRIYMLLKIDRLITEEQCSQHRASLALLEAAISAGVEMTKLGYDTGTWWIKRDFIYVASFTKEVNLRLAKRPLKWAFS